MKFIKKLLHDYLDWGFPYHRDYDGFQWIAKCEFCDYRLYRDSADSWFHLNYKS